MKKNPSSVVKITIAVILIIGFGALFGFEGTASAPEMRKGPEALLISGIQVLAGGSPVSYPGWIADNDLNTAWQPDAGAAAGVVEFQFAEPALLYGIKVSAALNDNDELAFEYLQDGQWVPLPAGRKKGGSFFSAAFIPTANLRVVTSAVRLFHTTTPGGESKIYEVGFSGIAAGEVFHKLAPVDIRTSNGPDIVSPVEYLTDNNTYTIWSASSFRADMLGPPWDYFDPGCGHKLHRNRQEAGKTPTGKPSPGEFEKLKHGDDHGSWNGGSFVMGFPEGTRLKELRFFPDAESLDGLKVTAKSGSRQIPVYQYRGNFQNDWTIVPLISIDDLNGLSVELDGKHGRKAGMAELECWGYGDYRGRKYLSLTDGSGVTLDKAASFIFQDENKGGSELFILIEGRETRTLSVRLNNETRSLVPAKTADGNTRYTLPLRPLADADAEQSITVFPFDATVAGQISVLLGIWLRDTVFSGEQEEEAIASFRQQGVEHAFAERVLLHDVEIYRPDGASFNAEGRKGEAWSALETLDGGSGFDRWRAPAQFAGELDGLRLSGVEGTSLWGMRTLGSVESDHAPVVKILYPSPNMEFDPSGHNLFPFAVAAVDNEKVDVTINGRSANKMGKYYVGSLAELGLFNEGSVTIHAEAIDQSGRKGEDSVFVSLSDFLFTVNLRQGITRTDKPSIVVSGTTQTPNVAMTVNGRAVDVRRKSYRTTVTLLSGMNYITIYGKDSKTGKERTAVRRVLYDPVAIALTIDNPLPGQYLSTPAVQVSGNVTGGGLVRVRVNGIPAELTGNRYLSRPVSLKEGANAITVRAYDSLGRRAAKSVTVYRDTSAPVISSVVPAEGALLTTGMILVSATVSDASPLWVIVNGIRASQNGNVYHATVPVNDGSQNLTILAEDRAGNKTAVSRTITVDTQPPLPFTVTVTPSGWTNNPRPVVTFSTADQTSGIDHYELKVDSGAYTRVTSPYTLPALADGTHDIIVKAVDKAGWEQIAAAQAFIDTAQPAAPLSFNLIPGTGKVILKYGAPSDDTALYLIERSPAWEEGLRQTIEITLTDPGLTNGEYYSYRAAAVDRAGNQSAFTAWKSALCGRELEPYVPTERTIAKYDGAEVYVAAQGLLEGSAAVAIREAQVPALEERAAFVRVSPIFDFAALDNAGKSVKPGETLPYSYLGVIRYEASLIPAGLDEGDLDVYYYDPLWNRWRICDSVVDRDTQQVYFTSRHFSLYEVQATAAKDLDPDEVKNTGYSPFRTYMQHGSLDVAPDNGGLSNRVTELVLSGPAGFDLTLSRLYSTAYAKADAMQVTETALLSYLRNKADFAFTIAKGIRLDLPYIKNAGRNEYLVLSGGGGYSFFELKKLEATSTQVGEGENTYDKYTLKLAPEEGEDFVLSVEQYFNKKITIKYSSDDYDGQEVTTCGSTSYKLTMKDGSEIEFDGEGKPTKITDANGFNSITFAYKNGGTQLDYIQDAIGRKVLFDYDVINNLPYIKKITVADDAPYNREIAYTHDENGYLTSETDAGGRSWSYTYENYSMPAKQTVIPYDFYAAAAVLNYEPVYSIVSKYENAQTKCYSVPLLKTLRGPGKGILEAEYGQFSESMTGFTVTKRVYIYTSEERLAQNKWQRLSVYDYKAKPYELPSTGGINIPADKRGYIYEATSRVGDRESAYTFEAFAKKNAQWVITSDLAGINSEEAQIKQVMGDNLYSVSTRQKRIERKDYVSGAVFGTEEYIYPETPPSQRPIETTVTRGGNSSTTTVNYDKYGNITFERKLMLSHDRINKVETKRIFIDEPDPEEIDANFKPYDDTGFAISPLTSTKHNLPLREMVINYSQPIENGIPAGNEEGLMAQYRYKYYQYNSLGQPTAIANWDSSKKIWLVSETSYDNEVDNYSNRVCGNVIGTKDPEGQVVEFSYNDNGYMVSKIAKDIKDADGKSSDITMSYGYEPVSGWLSWQKNPRGYVIEFLYDKLGRQRTVIYPDDDDDINYQGGSLSRIANPKKQIIYNDEIGNLFAEATDPVGAVTRYQFDDFGQLTRVIQFNRTEKNTSETAMTYNQWGDVLTQTDPNGKTTSFEYDALGRSKKIIFPDDTPGDADNPRRSFEYDDSLNLMTMINERGKKSMQRIDIDGRVIETTTYNGTQAIQQKTYYDGVGNQVAVIGPKDNEELIRTYNSLNLAESQISSAVSVFENGETKSSVRPEVYFSYDKASRLEETTVIGPNDKKIITVNIYDGLGRQIENQTRDPSKTGDEIISRTIKYYDPNCNIYKELDANNASLFQESERKYIHCTYSARDKLLSKTDTNGQTITYEDNPDDTVAKITGPRGNSGNYPKADFTVNYTYDDLKRLIKVDLPPKETNGPRPEVTFVYDKRGNLLKKANPLPDNGETTYTYDARNKVLSETVSDRTNNEKRNVTQYEYDVAGNLTKTIDPRKQETKNEYDDLNRLKKTTRPDGGTVGYEYDIKNNCTAVIDGRGNRTEFTYNLYKKMVSMKTAGETTDDPPYQYYYDRLGNLTKTVDMLNNTRTFTYDQLNRLTCEKDEEGGLYTFIYDQMTNIRESTDPNGIKATYTYTPDYKIDTLTLVNSTLSQSKVISYTYDEDGFITSVDDDGIISSYNNYNAANGTGYQPDAYGRIKKEVTAIGGKTFTTRYQYDVMDRMTGITYPNNNQVTYNYNALGEVTGMPDYVQPDSITYDHSLVTSLIAANGVKADFEYDPNGRIKKLNYTGKAGDIKSYSLTYDKAGNIIQKNQDMFKYDEENRLVEAYLTGSFSVDAEKEQQAIGAVQEDVLGDRQLNFELEEAVEDPTLLSLDYNAGSIGVDLGDSYNMARIELTPLAAPNRVTPQHIRVFVSDDNNPKSYVEKKSFTAAYKSKGESTILEIAFTEKVEARYVKVKTDFNERDLVTFQAINVAQFKNSPDKLIKVYYKVPNRTEKYSYDLMGNRKTETIILKDSEERNNRYYPFTNRLMANGRWAYVYDANGNVVGKADTIIIGNTFIKVKEVPESYWDTVSGSTSGLTLTDQGNGVYWQYSYDLMNRMTKVTRNGIEIAAYTYNWKGYRVKKEKLNAQSSETKITYYLFSPNGKLLYQEETEADETPADPAFFRQYDYLFNKLFAKDVGHIDSNGVTTGDTRFYLHTDHLGSVVSATDSSGNLVWSNEFTPFGSAADSENKPDGGFRFASYEYDGDVQLNYALARWQDPETGRFTSLDPARDGVNWYVYCGNNPLGFVDPMGLDYSSYGEAFGYSYSNYESGRLAGGEAAGGGGGNDILNSVDWITELQARWDPELNKALQKRGIIITETGKYTYSDWLYYTALYAMLERSIYNIGKILDDLKINKYVDIWAREKQRPLTADEILYFDLVEIAYRIKEKEKGIIPAPIRNAMCLDAWLQAGTALLNALSFIPGPVGKAAAMGNALIDATKNIWEMVAGKEWFSQKELDTKDYIFHGVSIAMDAFIIGSAVASKIREAAAAGKATKYSDGFQSWLNKGEKNTSVYYGFENGKPVYTGITRQELAKRLYQHNYGGKNFETLMEQVNKLTPNQAKAVEQFLIENGPANILNIRNSISPDSPFYKEALSWAEDFLNNLK